MNSIKHDILSRVTGGIAAAFLAVEIICNITVHNLVKEQTLQSERQKLEQYVNYLNYMQENSIDLARSVAIDSEVQSLFFKDMKESSSYERLKLREDLNKRLDQYALPRKECYNISLVLQDGTYISNNENDITNYFQKDWYIDFKKSGLSSGFAKMGEITIPTGNHKVAVLPYILTCYDMNRRTDRTFDIVVGIAPQILDTDITKNDALIESCILYDYWGEALFQKGSSSKNYNDIRKLAADGEYSIEVPEGNYFLLDDRVKAGWICVMELSSDALDYKVRDALWFIPLVMAVAGIILVLALSGTILRITRPIHQLAVVSKAIGEGKLDTHVEISAKNELQDLADAFNLMTDNLKEYMKSSIRNEKAKMNMQISQLILQINPHFIYNTLNTIIYMAEENGCKNIADFTEAFIALLQDTLSADTSDYFTTLGQEILNVRNYIKLQKYRYDDRVEVFYEIPEELLDCKVPAVLLQPIVENAIFHGILAGDKPGMIAIRACAAGADLYIFIQDNGVGMSEQTRHAVLENKNFDGGTLRKIGVDNVINRIRYIYGEKYGLDIESKEGLGTSVNIHLPCEHSDPEKDGRK